MKAESGRDLEERVKRTVLRLMERGATFNALDVSDSSEIEHIAGVVRIMKRLFEEGHFERFGYKRTLVQDRTQKGVMTTVAFAPATKREERASKAERERSRASIKRRAEEARPFSYLGLGLRDARKLERQTQTIRAQAATSGREIVRLGELLLSVHALVGARGAARYVEEALSMSRDSARRLMRVAMTFKGHPRLEGIAAVRPVVLYKITEPSFPSALREAILRHGGLKIDERNVALESVRVRDLVLAKRAWIARIEEAKVLQRTLDRASTDEARADVRARLKALHALPPFALETPDLREKQAEALQGITKGAKRLLDELGTARHRDALPDELEKEATKTLRRLLAELEKKAPER